MACPLNLQPAVKACSPGPTEVKYTGNGQSANVSNLEPYTTYNLRVVSYNSVGSSASEWVGFTTEKERKYEKSFRDQHSCFRWTGLHSAEQILCERWCPQELGLLCPWSPLLPIHSNSVLGLDCSFLRKYFLSPSDITTSVLVERKPFILPRMGSTPSEHKSSSITRRLVCGNKHTAINGPWEKWSS